MQNFIFDNPTRIIFGKGMIARIGNEVKRFGTNVLLVYGQGSIKKHGIYDQVISSLTEANLSIVEFPGVKANPVFSHVLKGIELARSRKHQRCPCSGRRKRDRHGKDDSGRCKGRAR